MQSLAPTATAVKPLSNALAQWLEARGFTVDATNGKASRVITIQFVVAEPVTSLAPAELGAKDARDGKPCCPAAHFSGPEDVIKYMRGDYLYGFIRAKGW